MEKVLTVSQLNNYIKGVFEDELILHNICVLGEIFEFKIAAGNSYILLKEGDCILRCVYFNSMVEFKVGQKISIIGSVKFYPKSGNVSFIINSIKLLGRGEILELQEKIKEQLKKEGVFSNNRSLPALVKDIALITSTEGAVMHDFLEVLKPMGFFNITIFSTKVQGDGTDKQIIRIISEINSGNYGKFDVVVIARGGGSAVDLNEFNSDALARKVHSLRVPVISAIGHETDYTFCDFAADVRAGTPSIAAGIILENNKKYLDRLYRAANLTRELVFDLINKKAKKLKACSLKGMEKAIEKNKRAYYSTFFLTVKIRETIENLYRQNINVCKKLVFNQYEIINNQVKEKEKFIQINNAKLEQLNPNKILSKGYAKIYKKGKTISLASELNKGDDIEILLSDGKKDAQII